MAYFFSFKFRNNPLAQIIYIHVMILIPGYPPVNSSTGQFTVKQQMHWSSSRLIHSLRASDDQTVSLHRLVHLATKKFGYKTEES